MSFRLRISAIVLLLLMLLVGCNSAPLATVAAPTPQPIVPLPPTVTPTPMVQPTPTAVVTRALFVIFDQFEELEYNEPRAALEKQGVSISVASSGLNSVMGSMGHKVQPDVALGEVQTADYAAIVFIGGYNYDESNADAIRIAQEAVSSGQNRSRHLRCADYAG